MIKKVIVILIRAQDWLTIVVEGSVQTTNTSPKKAVTYTKNTQTLESATSTISV